MIVELAQLAKKLRSKEKDQTLIHDALTKERVGAYVCVSTNGSFQDIIPREKEDEFVEDLVRMENKGRTSNVLARLVVDNEKYVLGMPNTPRIKKCLNAYVAKLDTYKKMPGMDSVLAFYKKNRKKGLKAAQKNYQARVKAKQLRPGINFAFLIQSKGMKGLVVHKQRALYKELKQRYDQTERDRKGVSTERCSSCGSTEYRVRDIATHGTIRYVPNPNTTGNYLVSFEGEAFASYGLEGNNNALVCTHCAKAYVDALNWLLAPSAWIPSDKKGKNIPIFKNRKDISDDTASVFWLRDELETPELDLLDKPDEGRIRALFDSVYGGRPAVVKHLDADMFYAITLSGAAARIAVRDWIETSVENLRSNLARWFQDIEIGEYDKHQKKLVKHYPSYSTLVWNVKSKGGKDVQHGRIGAALWKCAVMGDSPPLWLLGAVLSRIRAEQGRTTSERIALLKLCLNRRITHQERSIYMSALDETQKNIAYTCGRIFAVLESIQYYAMGGDINAGIRQRFFSFASTMPATAFGRLMKLAQHHLSKIRGEKPGLAVNLDKKIQDLMYRIDATRLPATFSLEDQASFAIGYYHQKQRDFAPKPNDKEN